MNALKLRIHVDAGHGISGIAPAEVPEGDHDVVVVSAPRPRKPFRFEGFPIDHGTWDDLISLRREDMYGDDGR